MASASEVVMFGLSIPSFLAAGIWGLGLFFILAVTYLTSRTISLTRQSRRLRFILNDILAGQPVSPATIEELDTAFSESPVYDERWRQLRRSLSVAEPETGGTILVSPIPVRQIFSSQEILASWVNMRFIDTVPALISSVGLLLTFLAILFGLNGAIVSSNSSSTAESLLEFEKMRVGIVHLVSNLSGKFLASVCALGSSAIFVLYERIVVAFSLSAIVSVRRILDESIEFQSSDRVVREIHSAVLESVNRSRIVSAHIPQYIRQEVHNAAGATLERMEGLLHQLCTVASGLKKRGGSIEGGPAVGFSFEQLEESQQRMINSITDQMSFVGKSIGSVSETIEQMASAVAGSTKQMSKDSQEVVGVLREFVAQSKEERQALGVSFQKIVSVVQDVVSSGLQSVAEGLDRTTASVTSSVSEVTTTLSKIINEPREEKTGELAEIRSVVSETFGRLNEVIEKIAESTAGLSEMKEVFGESARSFSEASERFGARFENHPVDIPANHTANPEILARMDAGFGSMEKLGSALDLSVGALGEGTRTLSAVVESAQQLFTLGENIMSRSQSVLEDHSSAIVQQRTIFEESERALKLFIEKLDDQVWRYNSEALEAVRNQVLSGANEQLSGVYRAFEDTGRAIAQLPQLLGNTAEQIVSASDAFDRMMARQNEAAVQQLEKTVSGIASAEVSLKDSVAEAGELMTSSVKTVLSHFEGMVSQVVATLETFADREKSDADMSAEIKRALEGTSERLIPALTSLSQSLAAGEWLKDALDASARAVADGATKVTSIVEVAKELQVREESLTSQNRNLIEQHAGALERYQQVFSTLDQSIAKIMSQLEEQIWRFQSQVQEQLQGSLQHYDELTARGLVTFESAITNLSDVLIDHRNGSSSPKPNS
jgi:ABC-type transporter Mla subunit MlaD